MGRSWRPPLEGSWDRLLVLRDLPSGTTLASWPAMAEDSLTTQLVLEHSIALHGPPLVLKTDNGPGFRAHDLEMLLAREGILHLCSPLYTRPIWLLRRRCGLDHHPDVGVGSTTGTTREALLP